MDMPRRGAIFATALAAAGCGTTQPRTEWAVDTAAIHRIYREAPGIVEAKDVERYMAMLDDSVAMIGTGLATIHGHAATRDLLNAFFAAGRYRAILHPPHIVIADSLASVVYTGVLTTYPTAGDSVVARNRYVDALRRQADGSWRILVHSWQPDVPAP